MSARHYEELWREGVEALVDQLDAEHPPEPSAAPKGLEAWARVYVRYVAALRKLCEAHDGLAQPQKRRCLGRLLDACTGRVLELRAWLAQLNDGVEVLGDVLGEQLAALQLTPDALELPVPSHFREARSEALAARAQAAAAAAAGAARAGSAAGVEPAANAADGDSPGTSAQDSIVGQQQAAPGLREAAEEQPRAAPQGQQDAAQLEQQQQQGGEDGAVAECAEPEERRAAAATVVQAGVRGWLARRRVAAERRAELEFLGMAPPTSGRGAALQERAAAIAAERKQRQAERQAELDEVLVAARLRLKQREGWGMKEGIRDELNDWFLKSRNPETGEYPDLPEAAKGGSRAILHPPPPEPTPEEAAAAAKAAGKAGSGSGKAAAGAGGKGKGGKGAAPEPPPMTAAFLEGLREAVQEYVDVWQGHQPVDHAQALLPPELQGMLQPRGGSSGEAYDADMVEAEVRPVVYEEVRLEADDEMRRLIASIKDMIKAEREGRKRKGGSGKKGKKAAGGKKGEAAKGGKEGGGKKEEAAKGGKKAAATGEGDGGAAPKKKKAKDLTAGRSVESIFAELAAAGLVPPAASVADFLGGPRLVRLADVPGAPPPPPPPSKPKTGGKKANAAAAAAKPAVAAKGAAAGAEQALKEYPEPSLAEARQAVVASCILPLGAHPALSKLQPPRTVLLYGPPGTGKSLLCRAVAHQSGATLFDLSPGATAGKYAGKAAATMVHMVFKAAKALAPSVVLLEDVDQVFVSDKTRAKALAPPGGEPPNRIKKQLLAEVADLEPGDGVLVLCTSRAPQACVKKDERALLGFVQRYIQLPLPDHGSRLTLLDAFSQREGLDLEASLSLLVDLTDGLSAGQLLEFVQQLAAHVRSRAALQDGTPGPTEEGQAGAGPLVELALELLPSFARPTPEALQELREWSAKAHSPLPPEEEAPKKDGKKGGKK